MKTVSHRIHVDAPVEQAYQAYRNYYGLNGKMNDVEVVEVDPKSNTSAKVLHWKVKAKAGVPLEWKANVISEVQNKEIKWAENEDSTIKTHGSVQFYKTDSNACEVVVECHYNVAGNDTLASIGEAFANPQELLEENLHDYKQHVESLASTSAAFSGQTAGNVATTKNVGSNVQPTDTGNVSVPYLHA